MEKKSFARKKPGQTAEVLDNFLTGGCVHPKGEYPCGECKMLGCPIHFTHEKKKSL